MSYTLIAAYARQVLNDCFSHQLPIIRHSAVITTNIYVFTANGNGAFSKSLHGTFSGSRHGERIIGSIIIIIVNSTVISKIWRKLHQPHHYYTQQRRLHQ